MSPQRLTEVITERNAEIRDLEGEADLLRGEVGSMNLYVQQLKDENAALTAEVERLREELSTAPEVTSGTRIYNSMNAASIVNIQTMTEAELFAQLSATVKAIRRCTEKIFLAKIDSERFRWRMKRDSAEEHQTHLLDRIEELHHGRDTLAALLDQPKGGPDA